jgi:beta-N-acetylhexosaminidase
LIVATLDLPLPVLCGQIIVGGFGGEALGARFSTALREGRRGGAILFKRNLPDVDTAAGLCEAIRAAAQSDLPPFIGVDQEGGRVQRLRAPVLQLPAMRALGSLGDLTLVRRAARALGGELAAIGFNLDFAPVLDVDSNPANPVIGDRAFGNEPRSVMRNAVAFMAGLQDAGVLACGKHFPGHGDTDTDSHLSLPVVRHDRARLEHVELPPFRAASGAGIASLMTAHVVCESLDAGVPATMSRAICASLLRAEIGFEGVLFSDDLEMGAIRAWGDVQAAAVEAVWAGCDSLLVCSDEDAQDAVHEALVRKAESDRRFHERCTEAVARSLRVRRLAPPRPAASKQARDAIVGGETSAAVARDIELALAARGPSLS